MRKQLMTVAMIATAMFGFGISGHCAEVGELDANVEASVEEVSDASSEEVVEASVEEPVS